MAEVSLRHVTKRYAGGSVAVKDLSLELKDGEFLVLTGPAESGKSTVLRMIAGLEEPTEGEILIDGVNQEKVPARERGIALVFQNSVLYPEMTVYENMDFGLRLRRRPEAERDSRIRRAAALLELTEVLDCRPGEIDELQRQKTALGRAIVHEPAALLLDEPFAKLQRELRWQMRRELERLHRSLGLTILYITEDQEAAVVLGDRSAVLQDGVLQQVDRPENLYRRPASLAVAGCVGAPRISLMECEVREKGGDENPVLFLDGQDFQLPEEARELLSSRGYIGKKVVLGLRADAMKAQIEREEKEEDRPGIRAQVLSCEIPGEEAYLWFETADTEGAVKTELQAEPEDRILLEPDLTRAYFFDRESGLAIR